MADNTKLQYIVELLTQGDTKKATDELKKLEASGKATSSSMADIGRQFTAAFALIAGSQFITQSIQSFLEAERSVAKLNAALKSTGQFTPEVSESMQELAKAMAQTSTFADEAILNVIAKLTAMGARTQDVERLTRSVLDLSTLMDRDLNRATLAMANAISGRGVDAFRALGFSINDTLLPSEQLREVLEQITQKAGGQSAAAVETLGGKFEVMNKNLGELKETLGGIIVQFGEPFIKTINDASKAIADFAEKNKAAIQLILTMASPGLSILRAGAKAASAPKEVPIADLGPEATATLQNFFASGANLKPGPAPGISTPGLSEADQLVLLEEKWKLDDAIVKKVNEEYEQRERTADLEARRSLEAMENYRNFEAMKQDLHDQITLTILDGEQRVQAEMQINHQRRVQMIQDAKFETEEQYMEAMTYEEALFLAEQQRYNQSQTYSYKLKQDMQGVAQSGAQAFSSGLASAAVEAFDDADKAFQKFAANFFRTMAEMIFQAMILRAVKGALGLSDGGQVTAMASGGMILAANGVAGVSDVSSPTYFPKFNVLAGEAGREVMTVLARPRFERINGVPAQIGYAGGNRLAITSADALARGGGGAGGMVDIRVTLSPEVKAEIVNQSVQNARVAVVQDMSTDSQLSRVTRQKVS